MDEIDRAAQNRRVRLLEREAQLSSLAEYAAEARAGQGRLVLVSGEAGAGKSVLLDRFELDLPDARWFWGACDGLFTPQPLAPALDIARQIGGELGELARTGAPRQQLFDAVLAELSTTAVLTVLVIEDVHWADEATLDLLRFLGRRIRGAPALLLVTFRDDSVAADDPLRTALGDLSTQRSTRRLSLPLLSEQAVGQLVEGTGLEPHRLHQLTAGNPFFVAEVLQTSGSDLPASVRDAVLARIAALSPGARRVLDTAALIGAKVQPELLVAATGGAPEQIDEVLATGVLVGDEQHLRFRHEIARMAIQAETPPHRAVLAHRAILDALLAAGVDDDARLAYHAEAVDDDALVLAHAPAAGRRASELAAHREACLQFERALRATSRADDRTVATLYDALAHELALVDRWQDSATAREEALRLWRSVGDEVREGDSLRLLSRTMWRLCRGAEAEQASVAAIEKLAPLGPSRELAWANANLANHRLNRGEHEQAIMAARQAREIAEQFGLTEVVTDALNTEACAAAGLGTVWSPMLHRALDLAKANGLDEQAGRAYANLYSMYSRSMKIAEGEGVLVEGIAYCDEHDISTFANCLRGERAIVLEKLGRWDEAEALAARLLQSGSPSPVNRLNPLVSLGKVRARRGDPAAWECLDQALTLATTLDEQEWVVLARVGRAEAHWLHNRLDEALGELDLADAGATTHGLLERAMIALWRHRISAPHGLTPDDEVHLEPFASELAGDHRRAAQLWHDRGLRYDAALALVGSGDEAAIREGLCALDILGAAPAASIGRQALRRLGVRSIPSGVRSTTKAHPAGLTRRQQEVLALVCEGLSNEEIAGRLFVSVKTTEHHVSAVLGKLGVTSRKAAAAEANRLGLVAAEI